MNRKIAYALGPVIAALGLSSCSYDDYGQYRYGQTATSDTASIWNRASRYGLSQHVPASPPRARRYEPGMTYPHSTYPGYSPGYPGYSRSYPGYSPAYPYEPPVYRGPEPGYPSESYGMNRYGAGAARRPALPDTNHQQYQYDQPRLSDSVSRYQRSQEQNNYSNRANSSSSSNSSNSVAESPPLKREVPRFTPRNETPERERPVSGELPTTSTRRNQEALASSSNAGKSSSSSNSGGNTSSAKKEDFGSLPFAVPVPGKVGYVTLPAPNNNLPEIDVRGIAPGTPVEIPDPNRAGKTIQFKVP